MTKIAISYSRLADFKNCPLLFREKYITKSIKFQPNAAMERGSAIHKSLERNVVRALHDKPPVGDRVVLDTHPIIEAFIAKHPIITVEEKTAFNDKWQQREYFDKDVFFRSVIDLEGRTLEKNGVVSIIDFKTGKYNESKEQLKLYNMVALLKYPEAVSASSALLFVDQKRSSPVLTTNRSSLKDCIHEVMEQSEAIQIADQKDDWPAQKCFQCRWCGVHDCRYITRG